MNKPIWQNPKGGVIPKVANENELLAVLLNYREIAVDDAQLFFDSNLICEPTILEHMEEAGERLQSAIKNNQKIVVYGDYDVDGVSASVIMSQLIESAGGKSEVYIPHRMNEGYGLNENAIEELAKQKTELLVVVDAGIANLDEVALAKKQGMDVIILDHHHIGNEMPDAIVIHPTMASECQSYCAAGLAYQFARFFTEKYKIDFNPNDWIDLVAMATVADVVPLLKDNRAIVKQGLKKMRMTPLLGVRALMAQAKINPEEVNGWHLGFLLGPRINAAGRIEHAQTAFDLFRTNDLERAQALAQELNNLNQDRQDLTKKLIEKALVEAQAQVDAGSKIILVTGDYSIGVAGIVAARLAEQFYLPAIVGQELDGKVRASARSISGVDLMELLVSVEELLVGFGGHSQAAGLSFEISNKEKILEGLNQAMAKIDEEHFQPKLKVEAWLDRDLANRPLQLLNMLERFEPFGLGNARPVLAVDDFAWHSVKLSRDGKHILGMVRSGDAIHPFTVFGMGDKLSEIEQAKQIAFTIKKDDWYKQGYAWQIVGWE